MKSWAATAIGLLAAGENAALVTITAAAGSTPREAGAAMLVTPRDSHGTIGGGTLEHRAIDQTRRLLAAASAPVVQDYPLGPLLNQCCGGHVQLLIERLTKADLPWLDAIAEAEDRGSPFTLTLTFTGDTIRRDILPASTQEGCFTPDGTPRARLPLKPPPGSRVVRAMTCATPDLLLYGAGHVGRALAPILATLPFRTIWLDDRPDAFPAQRPHGVICIAADIAAAIDRMSPGAYILVMTHDHTLDYEIVARVLARGDAAWCGMIGSDTKSARFRARLARDGLDSAGLISPIGAPKLTSKLPAIIAVSAAAEILAVRDRRDAAASAAPTIRHPACAC